MQHKRAALSAQMPTGRPNDNSDGHPRCIGLHSMTLSAPNLAISGVFGAAAVACFVGAARGSPLRQSDARTGLRALLVTVGLWASLQSIQMLVTDHAVAEALYLSGLIVGFGTVWAWLFFASAYTGHSFHRHRPYQLGALAIYVALILTKLTNPIHEQYLASGFVVEPYPRLIIYPRPIYWISFVLAYGFTAIGLYLLFRTFTRSSQSSWALSALVAITALSALPKIAIGVVPEVIPELSYEPIGVAIFGLGALYLVEDSFVNLEAPTRETLFDEAAEGVVTVGADGAIREYNDRAAELVPALDGDVETLAELTATPLIDRLSETTHLVEQSVPEGTRTLLVTRRELELGPHRLGTTLFLQDITDARRRKAELTRHDEQLEAIADAIAHELRNAVGVTEGYLALAASESDAPTERDPLEVARQSVRRSKEVIGDLDVLTRYAQSIETYHDVDVRLALDRATESVDADLDVHLERDATIRAADDRLTHLFVNATRFAAYAEATALTVRVETDPGRLVVTDDGHYTGGSHDDSLFGYDAAEPTAEAGLKLPNVRSLSRVHGWDVHLDTTYDDGIRYRIGGVDVIETAETTTASV